MIVLMEFDTLKQTAKISQSAGGIGLAFTMYVQQVLTFVELTELQTESFLCYVFYDTARYVDQGGGKRKGSFAIYIETWHADIFDFRLEKEYRKRGNARDLFFAMWTSLFMKRVQEDGTGR
jgi:ribonucleoside-diphosphate reductase alpha chain